MMGSSLPCLYFSVRLHSTCFVTFEILPLSSLCTPRVNPPFPLLRPLRFLVPLARSRLSFVRHSLFVRTQQLETGSVTSTASSLLSGAAAYASTLLNRPQQRSENTSGPDTGAAHSTLTSSPARKKKRRRRNNKGDEPRGGRGGGGRYDDLQQEDAVFITVDEDDMLDDDEYEENEGRISTGQKTDNGVTGDRRGGSRSANGSVVGGLLSGFTLGSTIGSFSLSTSSSSAPRTGAVNVMLPANSFGARLAAMHSCARQNRYRMFLVCE